MNRPQRPALARTLHLRDQPRRHADHAAGRVQRPGPAARLRRRAGRRPRALLRRPLRPQPRLPHAQFELLVLCWKPGQASTIHDHAGSLNVTRLYSGELTRRTFRRRDGGRGVSEVGGAASGELPRGPVELIDEQVIAGSGAATVDRGEIHQLANESGEGWSRSTSMRRRSPTSWSTRAPSRRPRCSACATRWPTTSPERRAKRDAAPAAVIGDGARRPGRGVRRHG